MNAILVGASGSTGRDLLELLLKDELIHRIDVFARKDLTIRHNKLNIHIIDFNKPDEWKYMVKGDVLFSCLGTTLKAAGSKEAQMKVDYEYQLQFAKAAKENNVNSYVLVSSGFASTTSLFFYTRMKGLLEKDVKALKFSKLIIFNPPILIRKDSDRKPEVMAVNFFKLLNALGILKTNAPLPTNLLAKAMLRALRVLNNGEYAIKGQAILKYV